MATFSVPGIKVSGLAACVPRKEVSNYDYRWVTVKEREQLVKTIGVEKRRHVEKGMATSDMCQKAAQSLLEGLHWNPAEIELLIFVSQTRDYLIPQTSNILQHKLGLPTTAISLDISLGCSGYVYGLAVASAMMNSFGISKALLLVCLLYTSDAADDLLCVDLGGRRIIKKKQKTKISSYCLKFR